MLIQHIALVPAEAGVEPAELARVAAALQKQILRDFAPHWQVLGSVAAFPRLEDVPLGYWPVLITARELNWGTGVHLDENGQPYAQVEHSPRWSLDASRACLEMLVNPLGDRVVTASSPRAEQGVVQVLVEVCASCDDTTGGYIIDGVLVADFCTPAYFVPDAARPAQGYSFCGSLLAPLSLAVAGHLTWFDVASNSWWMRVQRAEQHDDLRLGPLDRPFLCVRELVSRQRKGGATTLNAALAQRVTEQREQAERAAQARARRLRALVGLPLAAKPKLLIEPIYESVRDDEIEVTPAGALEAAPTQSPAEVVTAVAAPALDSPASTPDAVVAVAPAARSTPEIAPPAATEQPESKVAGQPPARVARRGATAKLPARPTRSASAAGPAGSSVSSSIAPTFLEAPPARPSGFRDTRLLAVAAAVGVGFFALVIHERGANPAHARTHSVVSQPTPRLTLPAAIGPASSMAPAAPQPADSLNLTGPSAAGVLAAKPDAGSAASPADQPIAKPERTAHAPLSAQAERAPRRSLRGVRKTAVATPALSEPAAAAQAPSIEDLFETRR